MVTNKLNNILILVFPFIIISCTNDTEKSIINQIKYGFSFGKCIGYCRYEITLKKGNITTNCSGWQENVKTLITSQELDDSIWNSLNNDLDVTYFTGLPDTIGCPDCADGGAEWLEFELSSGEKHKVTFEYFNEPHILKNQIKVLRQILEQNKCN